MEAGDRAPACVIWGNTMKIAVGGFQHETNTFAPNRATLRDFEKHDAWPGLSVGDALIDNLAGMNIPLTGFVNAIGDEYEVASLVWCSAEPSSYVTQHAFDAVMAKMCALLVSEMPVDGVYLDLHGAMVVENFEDGEGEVISRIREIIGEEVPFVISLDFHANVTQKMFEQTDAMAIFRTYPHLDMAQTGVRAARLMKYCLQNGRIYGEFRRIPFLIPLTAQCTDHEPSKSLFTDILERETKIENLLSLDFAEGFPPADITECGPSLVAYSSSASCAIEQIEALEESVLVSEPRFLNELMSPADAVRKAMACNAEEGPVVLADVQDNPGAGATSDTVGLLEALVSGGAKDAVVAILNDPTAVRMAHAAGVGATIDALLGGHSGIKEQQSYEATFEVVALGNGVFQCTGAMYEGTTTNLGGMALLRVADDGSDVRVIVGETRFQCLDLAIFRHLGVEPKTTAILAVKSSVHFRADFEPIATAIIAVEAPGSHPCRLTKLPYKHLRSGVRLEPMGPIHQQICAD